MQGKMVETLWVSDIHLGNRDCQAHYLLNLLRHYQPKTLILAGDIIDFWSLRTRHFWPASHQAVISRLLELAHQGCRLIYVPGNHDEVLRDYLHLDLGMIEFHSEYRHTMVCGGELLVLHGDRFDPLVCHSRLTAKIGDYGYDFLLFLNRWCARLRRLVGLPYWSLAGWMKTRVHKANEALAKYRRAAIQYGISQQVDMVLCGHIHHAEIDVGEPVGYVNTGDWLESCTAVIEERCGLVNLVHCAENVSIISSYQPVVLNERQDPKQHRVA